MKEIKIDFGAMQPDAQIRFMRHNCNISIWPMYPFMPVVKGTPLKLETIEDYGFLYAGDIGSGKLIVHAGANIAEMIMFGKPQLTKTVPYKNEKEMADAGWRIDK